MKKRLLILTLLLCSQVAIFAEYYSKIAIVDMEKIVEVYFSQTEEMRDIKQIRDNIKKEAEKINKEINELELKKIAADRDDDKVLVAQLELDLEKLRSYLQDFIRINNAKVKSRLTALYQSQSLSGKIFRIIKQIGQEEGYTLILRKGSEYDILYYSDWIDITDQVIARLKA
ncbi:MAG: OmpH family outer membrane protein [Spirochaetales bacterium]|nr:OmpH family outer membrane protein [Spirochaetales bacterium]